MYLGRVKHMLLSVFAQAVAGRSTYPSTFCWPSKGRCLFLTETLKLVLTFSLGGSFTCYCSSFLWDITSVVANAIQEADSHRLDPTL